MVIDPREALFESLIEVELGGHLSLFSIVFLKKIKVKNTGITVILVKVKHTNVSKYLALLLVTSGLA